MTFGFCINLLKEYFFRRKTLNFLIWIVLVAILGELKAIGNSETLGLLLDELYKDYPYFIVKLSTLAMKFLFIDGNYLVIGVMLIILMILFYLKSKELSQPVNGEIQLTTIHKNEIIARVTDFVVRSEKLTSQDYISIMRILTENKVKDKLRNYYGFQRSRGNITALEKYVSECGLIDDLNKIRF